MNRVTTDMVALVTVLTLSHVGTALAQSAQPGAGQMNQSEQKGFILQNEAPKSPVATDNKGIGVGELKPGSTQGFNPQPDPPKAQAPNSSTPKFLGGIGAIRPGGTKGFNPQPDPPGTRPGSADVRSAKKGLENPGTKRGFNPQPDPPAGTRAGVTKSPRIGAAMVAPGAARGFNPQPEPPKTKVRTGAVSPAMPKTSAAGRIKAPTVKTR